MVQLPVWVLVLLAAFIVVLLLILWSVKRRRRPHLRLEPMHDAAAVKRAISGLAQGTVMRGNRITLLENGRFFDSLFRDLANARTTINMETFLCKDGEVTRRVAEILASKAAESVKVRLLIDGSGSRRFGKAALRSMREAGCDVRKFHPIRFSNLGLLNNRTHRKIAIIDGAVGYIGGHCLVDDWLGDAEDKKHFRDVSARVEGPVVAQLQSAFTDNWIEETGEVIGGTGYFPELEPKGESEAQVVYVSPLGGPSTMKLMHYAAIKSATTSITIQNPYFLPDPDARKALVEAVARGVEVRVMIPDAGASDAPLVQHASHHHYGTLLKGGVRLFDYQRTLLHQKVFVIDHAWCAIGSSNFDDRSFEINDEVSMLVFDEHVAGQLEKFFEADRKLATERTLREWQRRPALHKLQDGFAFLFNEQL